MKFPPSRQNLQPETISEVEGRSNISGRNVQILQQKNRTHVVRETNANLNFSKDFSVFSRQFLNFRARPAVKCLK